MELIFEIIIETVLELILDKSIEGVTAKKYSKPLVYCMGLFLLIVFAGVIGGIAFLGIVIFNENKAGGIALCIIAVVLFVITIMRFKKLINTKK